MKMTHQRQGNTATHQPFSHICLTQCRKLLKAIAAIKTATLSEFRARLGAHEHLLQLALNEAEALACQTAYPHLVFPTLATEKAQAVLAWSTRQRFLQASHSDLGRPA